MKKLLTFLLGSLFLTSAVALPAPAPTAEQAARSWCLEYEAPGSVEEISQRAFGASLEGFPTIELRKALERSFYRHSTKADRCAATLSNLAVSLEMYRADHEGQYPPALAALAPDDIKALPFCPGGGVDSYSASYKVSPDGKKFSLHCSGSHHKAAGMAANQPAWDWDKSTVVGLPVKQPAQRTCKLVSLTPSTEDPRLALARVEETTAAELDGKPVTSTSDLMLTQLPTGWIVVDVSLPPEQEKGREALVGAYLIEYWGMPTPQSLADVASQAVKDYFTLAPIQQMALQVRLSKEPMANLLNDDFALAARFQTHIQDLRALASQSARYYREHATWPQAEDLVEVDRQADTEAPKARLTPSDDKERLEISLLGSGFPDFKIPAGYPRATVDTLGRFRLIYRP